MNVRWQPPATGTGLADHAEALSPEESVSRLIPPSRACLFAVAAASLSIACRDPDQPTQPPGVQRTDRASLALADYTVFDLGGLGGTYTRPSALNDSAVVVGTSFTAAGVDHAFVWQNDTMVDLHQPTWFSHSSAVAITNDGVIGGIGEETEDTYFP